MKPKTTEPLTARVRLSAADVEKALAAEMARRGFTIVGRGVVELAVSSDNFIPVALRGVRYDVEVEPKRPASKRARGSR